MIGKKKIVHLLTSLNPGGVTTLVFNLLPGLEKKGYQNYIITTLRVVDKNEMGPLESVPVWQCLKWFPFYPKKWYRLGKFLRHSGKLSFAIRLYLRLRKIKPDIVHSHMHADSWVSQVVATRLVRAMFVITIHSPTTQYPYSWQGKYIFRKLLVPGDGVLADSEGVLKEYENFFAQPRKKGVTYMPLYPGVADTGMLDIEVKNLLKEKLNISQDCFVIGSIGRIVTEKRYQDLVSAFDYLFNDIPNCHLVLVGDGDYMEILKNQIHSLKSKAHIHLIGFKNNPTYWLNLFDVFVIPSLFEGFGIATIESMAKGIVVIGSDVNFTNKIIEHNSNGILFQPKNITQLAESIKTLLANPDLRERLIKNARISFEEKYTLSLCIRKHDETYLGLRRS